MRDPGIQVKFYEELSSSGRPEDGKEVPLTISRTRRERDGGRRRDKRRVHHGGRVIRLPASVLTAATSGLSAQAVSTSPSSAFSPRKLFFSGELELGSSVKLGRSLLGVLLQGRGGTQFVGGGSWIVEARRWRVASLREGPLRLDLHLEVRLHSSSLRGVARRRARSSWRL
ncbi:hypothetical protein Taro_003581 [Colocasia esculenta]|uniref:Uncharacterized protein n=1 Tax=Colocasia esculenta TaxID=4460 RepID=A0A843TFW5_COLES|nr:hypothetical protein [Colocasia esculenta]